MLNKIVARLTVAKIRPEDLSFEQARSILERASDEAKLKLAKKSKEPEILAYLSQDLKGEIRALVASNAATPLEVDVDLADDELGEVRIEIAKKISRLLPGLSPSETERIRDLTLKVIERLAADNLPRVRQILAEEIKHSRLIPKPIIEALAYDAEIAVAAPILEYSPLLADDDLLELIATSEVEGVLAAIARRDGVSGDVSEAVVATLDIPAISALLANESAKIRSDTLDRIIEHAQNIEAWHKPLVLRPELSMRAVRRISGFVASSLLDLLSQKHELDEETKRELATRVRGRLKEDSPSGSEREEKERIWSRVMQAADRGELDDEFVLDAIEGEERQRVVLSVAALGRVPEASIERILRSGSAQLITALAWHAGLQMRTAFALQKSVAKLSPSELLPARGGTDYPLTPDQMISQLQLMGVEHTA